MDLFKSKKRNTASSTPSARSSQLPPLAIPTAPGFVDLTASSSPYEALPTSSEVYHPSNRPVSPVVVPGAASNSQRLSSALNNLAVSSYGASSPYAIPASSRSNGPTTSNITGPVNLIPHIQPPSARNGQSRRREDDEEIIYNRSSTGRSASPSQQDSIRSVTSREGDSRNREGERSKRVESSTASEGSYRGTTGGRDGRTSVASSYSLGGGSDYTSSLAAKPLPMSPPPSVPTSNARASSGTGNNQSRDRASTASSIPSSHYPSTSSRGDTKSYYGNSTLGSIANSLNPRRTSATPSIASNYSPRPSTTHSFDDRQSISSFPVPSPHSAEFDFPRPASTSTIEILFNEILPRICSTPAMFEKMRALDIEKKWIMVHNEALNKWKVARENLTHRPVEGKSAPAVGAGASSTIVVGGGDSGARERAKRRGKNERPEWYVEKIVDQSITKENYESLAISLRTYELE